MRGKGRPQSPHSSGAAVIHSYENPKVRWTHQGTHLYWFPSLPKVVSSTDSFSAPQCTDRTPDPKKTKSQHFKGQQELNCILLMGKFCGIWKIKKKTAGGGSMISSLIHSLIQDHYSTNRFLQASWLCHFLHCCHLLPATQPQVAQRPLQLMFT